MRFAWGKKMSRFFSKHQKWRYLGLFILFVFSINLAFAAEITSRPTAGGGELTFTKELVSESATSSSPVSFKPTPGDVSMVFLGNIFGVVDGVLAGSGSQIVGEMFGIFNSAVLALGGIILMYTLLVSSLNTAHQGQFLGQKWSSVWVPIRSTVGIGLLLPKASGYCTMQIFVMWVVVQGVGAADSIWSAALNYLNRGGVIIQKQMTPSTSANADGGEIMNGAMGMVTGQVCMQALEQQIIKRRKAFLDKASGSSASGPCSNPDSSANDGWYGFCTQPVPNFMNSVNLTSQDSTKITTTLTNSSGSTLASKTRQTGLNDKQSEPMPNFKDSEAPYNQLNGICGTINWNLFYPAVSGLSRSEYQTSQSSRAIALYQMYVALMPVSNSIISNAKIFNADVDCGDASNNTCVNGDYAKYAYGKPLTMDYTSPCKTRNGGGSGTACVAWGTTNQDTVLFNGRELQDAVAAYNAIMVPVLAANKLMGSNKAGNYARARSFIREAESKGWLMAGAYFFKLAILNSFVINNADADSTTDTGSGLSITHKNGNSIKEVIGALKANGNSDMCKSSSSGRLDNNSRPFCWGEDPVTSSDYFSELMPIAKIIAGADYTSATMPTYNDKKLGGDNNNLFAYLLNANALIIPGQSTILDAGLTDDSKRVTFNPQQSVPELGGMSFGGGKWGIAGSVVTLLWNGVLKPLWNMLLKLMIPPVMQLFSLMITPMLGMTANIFNHALQVMRIEGVNPILALANMGTRYIDGVGNAWMALVLYSVGAVIFPPGFVLIMMFMPIVLSWMGVMLLVGFSAAYYVPFIPLLIFSFAGIGWLIGVIEAMVAAPIVALGVTHPEGHEAFGKSDQALMLLLSMFLRPAMMVLGYIFGIILSYVGVWVMNAGFNMTVHDVDSLTAISKDNIVPRIVDTRAECRDGLDSEGCKAVSEDLGRQLGKNVTKGVVSLDPGAIWDDDSESQQQMYGFWSKIFLFYFTVLLYSTLYISVVQQAFQMIYYLPDKVLRWLSGGITEQLGEGAAQGMTQEVKGKADEGGQAASSGMAKVQSGLMSKSSGGMADDGGGGGSSGADAAAAAPGGDTGGGQ